MKSNLNMRCSCLLQKENPSEDGTRAGKAGKSGLARRFAQTYQPARTLDGEGRNRGRGRGVDNGGEIYTSLPTPPFTDDEKAAMASRVYVQHVAAERGRAIVNAKCNLSVSGWFCQNVNMREGT